MCKYLPDKKKYSNSNKNMLFLSKTDETTWKPPFSTNPLFLSSFFMTPLFVQILKTRNPPLTLGGNYAVLRHYLYK